MQTRPIQLSRPRTDPEFEFGKFVKSGECDRRALEGADAPDSDRSVSPEIVSSWRGKDELLMRCGQFYKPLAGCKCDDFFLLQLLSLKICFFGRATFEIELCFELINTNMWYFDVNENVIFKPLINYRFWTKFEAYRNFSIKNFFFETLSLPLHNFFLLW